MASSRKRTLKVAASQVPLATPIHGHEGKKYLREIISAEDHTQRIKVDIYAVLIAYRVTCPARAHAIKKLLCAGQRGKGSAIADLQGVAAALARAIEIEQSNEVPSHVRRKVQKRQVSTKERDSGV